MLKSKVAVRVIEAAFLEGFRLILRQVRTLDQAARLLLSVVGAGWGPDRSRVVKDVGVVSALSPLLAFFLVSLTVCNERSRSEHIRCNLSLVFLVIPSLLASDNVSFSIEAQIAGFGTIFDKNLSDIAELWLLRMLVDCTWRY